MGLIIQDTLELPSGLSVTGAYATFAASPLTTYAETAADGTKVFTAAGSVSIFKDEASAQAGLDPVVVRRVQIPLQPDSVHAIYAIMYGGLAALYQNTQNVDEPPMTSGASAASTASPAAPSANPSSSS